MACSREVLHVCTGYMSRIVSGGVAVMHQQIAKCMTWGKAGGGAKEDQT